MSPAGALLAGAAVRLVAILDSLEVVQKADASRRGRAEVFDVVARRTQTPFQLNVESIVRYLRRAVVELGKEVGISRHPGESSNFWGHPHGLQS